MPKLTDEQVKQRLIEGRNYRRLYSELKVKYDELKVENKQLKQELHDQRQYFESIVETQAAQISARLLICVLHPAIIITMINKHTLFTFSRYHALSRRGHKDSKHSRSSRRSAASRAFTIVELLLVIVIIAILAAIAIVAYNGIQNRARSSSLQSSLAQIGKALEVYKITNDDAYPSSLAAASIATPSSGTYTYTAGSSTYCLSGTISGISYRVTSDAKNPAEGTCSGVLADGSSCPSGFIVVPGNSTFGTSEFCVMKYEAKNSGGIATSQASGAPWVNISQTSATTTAAAACSGCHLMTEAEWMTIAANVLSVPSNWSGGAVGSGYIYSGHNDNSPSSALAAATTDSDGYSGTGNSSGNQRRTLTLSNGEVIWDIAGNVWEWTSGTIAAGQQPGLSGEAAYVWKQWNSPSLLMNGLPGSSQPSAAGAGSYSSTQGIGQLYSNYGETGTRAVRRGGAWGNGTYAGVLALGLSDAPSSAHAYLGFRASR